MIPQMNGMWRKLDNAMFEAGRLLDRAQIAQEAIMAVKHFHGGKETAAAKRASMDLTRALAELRNP